MRRAPACGPGAFSLVEVALSLAVVSFAIIAILGLLPVALRTARESNRETRATLIARRIVDELRSLPAESTALVRGPSAVNPGWQLRAINLSSPSVHVLAYDEQGEGLATEINPEAFGDPLPFDAHFVAEVRVTPHFPFQGISRVQAAVEAPAQAPSSRRSRYVFVTLMRHR
jgi:hypothetical protein